MSPSTRTRPAQHTPPGATGPAPSRRRWIAVAAVGSVFLLALLAVWFFNRPGPSGTAPAQPDGVVDQPQDRAAEAPQDDAAAARGREAVDADAGQGDDATAPQPDAAAEPQPGDADDAPVQGSAPGTSPPSPLEDGRHATYLTALDVSGRTVTVDVIQFLTGEEAIDAYHDAVPDDPEGPPNDYWIVNDNPQLRTLPVALDATISLVRLAEDADADLDPGTWEELPTYLADLEPPDADRLAWNPFWIVVADGTVTAIEEQYLP
jgi:hypothetical protein